MAAFRRIRAAQEDELAASLAADRAREAVRRRDAEVERAEQGAEARRREYEAASLLRLREEHAGLTASLPQEPAAPDGILVRFILPAGRMQRRFPRDTPAEALHTAVLGHPSAPNRFRRLQAFPTRELPREGSLEQLFGGQAGVSVMVQGEDSKYEHYFAIYSQGALGARENM